MSRRPNPNADKAAANQAVIKQLLKLPGNKVCADCKRNKLPRWASWNLGVFVCIRCSGIHRGMGTHISRVKSVDLDTWTDEQLQSVVKWGNTRANKYWEAKLAPGHVPSEGKMENFVRTKYEHKRWVMDGGIPDPATLDDEDDDNVPLTVVKQKLDAAKPTPAQQQLQQPAVAPPPRQQNLFDVDDFSTPAPAAPVQPAKSTNDMLGDFFAAPPNPEPRSSSVNSEPGKMSSSRPDLNRSILSLYASAPKPPQSPTFQQQQQQYGAPQQQQQYGQQQQQHQRAPSTGAFGGMSDAFSSLSFSAAAAPAAKPSPFANLTSGMKKSGAAPQLTAASSNFFTQAPAAAPAAASKPSSGLDDLFDFSTPAVKQPAATNNTMAQFAVDNDAWVTPATTTTTAATTNAWASSSNNNSSSANAWGSSTTSNYNLPAQAQKQVAPVLDDDNWGDFSSGAPSAPSVPAKSGGAFDDDMFANVWK